MMNIARLLVITLAVAAVSCAPEKKDKEGSATSNSEAAKTFAANTNSYKEQYISAAMGKSNQALVLTSASIPAPLGSCVLAVDVVDPNSRLILVTYNNCSGIFATAPQLYECKNGYICEATNGDLSTYTQYGGAAVVTPYGGAAYAGPVASATVQYMYRIVLGNRTVMITRTMLNIGTSGTSNTQEFSFASSVPPSGYRSF